MNSRRLVIRCANYVEPVYMAHEDSEGQWATVHLPLSVPPDVRQFSGGKVKSRTKAKQYAAFMAILMLNEAGELDDRFRPVHLDIDEGGMVKPTVQALGSCKVREFHAGIAGCLKGAWDSVSHVYLSTIKVEMAGPPTPAQYDPLEKDVLCGKMFSVGIVTERRMQEGDGSLEFELPIREHAGHLKVVLTAGDAIPVDQDVLDQIRYFHSSAFGAFLRIKLEIGSDFGYMIAPVKIDDEGFVGFDYEALEKTMGIVLGQAGKFDDGGFKEGLASYISSCELATAEAIDERDRAGVAGGGDVAMANGDDVANGDVSMAENGKDKGLAIVANGDAVANGDVSMAEAGKEGLATAVNGDVSGNKEDRAAVTNGDVAMVENGKVDIPAFITNGDASVVDAAKEESKGKKEEGMPLKLLIKVPLNINLPPIPDARHPYEGSFLETIKTTSPGVLEARKDDIILVLITAVLILVDRCVLLWPQVSNPGNNPHVSIHEYDGRDTRG
jgi:hypothetical protein